METTIGYVVGALAAAAIVYFVYRKFSKPKNTNTGGGGGSKDGSGRHDY